MLEGVAAKDFFKKLGHRVSRHNDGNGAAALAYFLMLSIFPMAIALLSLLPYVPVAHLDQAIMNFLFQALPNIAATLFQGVVVDVVNRPHQGLLTFGLIAGLGSAASGLYAVMQQLNVTYGVSEGRPFYKVAFIAVMLMLAFLLLVLGAAVLIVVGGSLQDLLTANLGLAESVHVIFSGVRWVVIVLALLLGFALTYYFGPDVEQDFRFITPGSVFGTAVLVVASWTFREYVQHFADYSAAYGSLGAVIILMFWLYLSGWVLLLGSEINALIEHMSTEGKAKGEKRPHRNRHLTVEPSP